MTNNAKNRFSDRVTQYVKYRPGYPSDILELLKTRGSLNANTVIADVGSGTGKLSELFVKAGYNLFAVEPNDAMRGAAEQLLGDNANFTSVSGSAETTTLETGSIDLITVGQAFHWFDPESARREFRRIVKPGGAVMLAWNSWDEAGSALEQDYKQLVKTFALDYEQTSRTNVSDDDVQAFFASGSSVTQFDNPQLLDLIGLIGRVTSSSYMPTPAHPGYPQLEKALGAFFDRHAVAGQLAFNYVCKVYTGQL